MFNLFKNKSKKYIQITGPHIIQEYTIEPIINQKNISVMISCPVCNKPTSYNMKAVTQVCYSSGEKHLYHPRDLSEEFQKVILKFKDAFDSLYEWEHKV